MRKRILISAVLCVLLVTKNLFAEETIRLKKWRIGTRKIASQFNKGLKKLRESGRLNLFIAESQRGDYKKD